MSTPVFGLNPAILRWARERTGLSTGEVAALMHKDVAVVEAWEAGRGAPTYVQLEDLAYRVFKRPVALFFFPEPPEEPSVEQSFRTLPEFELAGLDADTRYRIRDARALQVALRELNEGRNPSERQIFRDLAARPEQPAEAVAAQARRYLGIPLATQTGWRTTDEALQAWRAAVEEAGVYVFKNTFAQREVSGFCLYDAEFPIIYVNNSTTKSRQIFTLFHELAHLLVRTSSITTDQAGAPGAPDGDAPEIEVFCNRFAAAFLLPEQAFRDRVGPGRVAYDDLGDIASEFHVSREFIARRMLDLGRISRATYHEYVAALHQEYQARASGSGGNYYNTRASYLGDKYLGLAFGRYYQGAISVGQLADYLGVRARSVAGLEEAYLRRAAR